MADEQTTPQNVEQGAPGTDAATAAPVQVALSPLLEAIRRPIPGGNPCGSDVSYDDDYLAIKAEIDKLSTVSTRVDQERATELRQMMDATRGTLKKADRAEAEKQLEQRGSVVQQAGGADYQLIKDRATRILSEKSKDIRLQVICAMRSGKKSFSPG
jgi:predicted component of type VI protein secretion system